MNCNITYSHEFARNLKHLLKKYRSIKTDLEQLVLDLRKNPLLGVDLGNNMRKI